MLWKHIERPVTKRGNKPPKSFGTLGEMEVQPLDILFRKENDGIGYNSQGEKAPESLLQRDNLNRKGTTI